MPSAGSVAGGGPDEHGARPREPRATARPSADRVRRDGACRREVPGRPDEALVEARLWRPVAAADRQAARQDGLPGAAQGMVLSRAARSRRGYLPQPMRTPAPVYERPRNSRQFRECRPFLAQGVGAPEPRAVAPDLPRPRRSLSADVGRDPG